MANEREIKIIIAADGSIAISELGKVTQSMKKMESDSGGIVDTIKKNWLGISAAIVGAWMTISKAMEYADLGAKAQQAEASFRTVATSFHENADQLLVDLKRVSAGTVADSDLMQRSLQGLMMGLKGDQIVKLLDVSRLAARVWGQDVSATFDTVVKSVAGGVRQMFALVQMGLITREQYLLLNKAMAQGIEGFKIYDLVVANATIEQAAFGKASGNSAEDVQRMHTAITEFKETLGKLTMEIVPKAWGAINYLAAGLAGLAKHFYMGAKAAMEFWALFGKGAGYEDFALAFDAKMQQMELVEKSLLKAADKYLHPKTSAELGLPSDNAVDAAKKKVKELMDQLKDAVGAKAAAKELEKLNQEILQLQTRTENLNPNIDKTVKGVNDLWMAVEILRNKIKESGLGAEIQKALGIKVDKALVEGLNFLSDKMVEENQKIAGKIADAYAKAAESELQTRIQIEDKINAYRLKEGAITESEAITKQYEGQRLILEGKQRQLIIEMQTADVEVQRTKDWTKYIELSGQYYDTALQIEATEKYQAFELDAARLANQGKINDALRQELDLQKKKYEEQWAWIMEQANAVGGEAGKGLGMMFTSLKGITDITAGTDQLSQEFAKKMEIIDQYYVARLAITKDALERERLMNEEYNQATRLSDEMTAQQKIMTYQDMAGAMAGMFYTMYAMGTKHNQAMFTMYKAFAIAEAIISTYAGAARALKDFPFPFSIAIAAIVTAAGLVRVAAIAAQKPGGTTGSVPSGGGGYNYTSPTTPSWQTTPAKPRPQIINYYFYGTFTDIDGFMRTAIPALNKAIADGVH